jgi:hypothetical protein
MKTRIVKEYISPKEINFLDIKDGNSWVNICSGSYDYCLKQKGKLWKKKLSLGL